MSALPDFRARGACAGPGRRLAGALAGILALALAAAPLGAQPAQPEAPADATPEAPADAPADATPEAPADATPEAPAGARPAAPAEPPATTEAPAAAVTPEPAAATSSVGNLSTRRSLAWIAIGAAAAFATTSAVLALAVESREQDLAFLSDFRAPGLDVPNRYSGQVRDRYEELVDEAETLSTYSWIALGLTGVAVASATALFLLDDVGAQAEAPASARGHLAPTMLPGGLGVTLDWEF
jgi:hypothetical protein